MASAGGERESERAREERGERDIERESERERLVRLVMDRQHAQEQDMKRILDILSKSGAHYYAS
jgi:hypothetical protein